MSWLMESEGSEMPLDTPLISDQHFRLTAFTRCVTNPPLQRQPDFLSGEN